MFNKSQIAAKIRSVSTRSAKLRTDIQIILVNIAGHAYEHGDVTMYDKLFAATSGVNRKKIAEWIRDYGFARLDGKTGAFKLNKKARSEVDFDTGEDVVVYLALEAANWWEGEADAKTIAKELDIAKRIESLAAALDMAIQDGKVVKLDERAFNKAQEHLAKSIKRADRLMGAAVK